MQDTHRGKHPYLVVTSGYPSADDLYNKAFVHTRVRYYRAQGFDVRVFDYDRRVTEPETYVFDGVPVTVGDDAALRSEVAHRGVRKLLVHFLTPRLGECLRGFGSDVETVVWFHGYGADGWHRRWWEHIDSGRDLREWVRGRDEHNARTRDFYQSYFDEQADRLQAVFVSAWFRDHVFGPDMGFVPEKSSVIHNPVDTSLFGYRKKNADDRLKVLLLRPFNRRFYGNDLAVRAIELGSRRDWFKEMQFTLVGDGDYWDDLTGRIAHLENVDLQRGFVAQREVPGLHARHGTFLVPSRKDTQGVSRDEAMSSGLVPITHAVDAIPDFVTNGEDAWLAPMDSAVELVEALERVHADPEMYLRMSETAAFRVRQQRSLGVIGPQELALFADTGL
ncbi:glycosyltransferase family 4 protein [Zhihengliuella halotolerans]|uniref:glycosyltransferase family 4 protein n=1 Tax=Zhihengliuella halotolerans TaxID=370736 RepID=UPI000C80F8B1|nr:glycosyltransferase family 4 protein [Zhihengliuella halotolerans]